MNNQKIEVIGIDHGWSKIKTVNSVIATGVKKITTRPALPNNIVYWGGEAYEVGGDRLEVRENKVSDSNFRILTNAAIGREMKSRGLRSAHILLAAGLPFTRFGAEKKDFINYLTWDGIQEIEFERRKYRVSLERVSVFPQCYAAVADHLTMYKKMVLVVDIGSWTIDIMPIFEQKPKEGKSITIPRGLITCMRSINEECVRLIGSEVSEIEIEEVMRGEASDLPEKYLEIIQEGLKEFSQKVYYTIKECGYNLETTKIVFAGGGAAVMKLFGNFPSENIEYIEDIRANAKGYEYLAKIYLQNQYGKK